MTLSEREKMGLREQLVLLLEGNEPEAVLTTLRRIAERKAHSVTRGAITQGEAYRYLALAEALTKVEAELERLNAPRVKAHERDNEQESAPEPNNAA